MKPYYHYVDAAKGVGILGVMMCHSAGHIFNTGDTLAAAIIQTFFLSLFFLVSGFIGAGILKKEISLKDIFLWKHFCLLAPFFVCGSLLCCWQDYNTNGAFTANPLKTLLSHEFNKGYWFLLTLTIIRFSILLSQWLVTVFCRKAAVQQSCALLVAKMFVSVAIGGYFIDSQQYNVL